MIGIIGAESPRSGDVKPAYLALLLLTATAFAVDCKDDPKVVAACFVVHGRMYNSSGGSLARIWRIGTQRILGVTGPHNLPSNVEPLMTDFDHEVVADFLVCPYQKDRPGEMRMVCVQSATHVVQRPASFNKENR
jgi:hypothetical protein